MKQVIHLHFKCRYRVLLDCQVDCSGWEGLGGPSQQFFGIESVRKICKTFNKYSSGRCVCICALTHVRVQAINLICIILDKRHLKWATTVTTHTHTYTHRDFVAKT